MEIVDLHPDRVWSRGLAGNRRNRSS